MAEMAFEMAKNARKGMMNGLVVRANALTQQFDAGPNVLRIGRISPMDSIATLYNTHSIPSGSLLATGQIRSDHFNHLIEY